MILKTIRQGRFREELLRGLAAAFSGCRSLYVRHQQIIGIAVLFGFAIGFMGISWLRPVYNWDLLAYIGVSAKAWSGSAAEIHAYAYDAMRAHVPADAFVELTQGDAYRLRQYSDPDAFVSMLPMYEVKWLYVAMLTWLIPFAGPLGASFLINCLAMAILTGSLLLWLRATNLLGYAPVVVMLLFLLQFQSFGVTQQPDFITNAVVVAGLLCLERARIWPATLLLFLAVLLRPDQAAILGVLFFCAWLLRDRAMAALLATFLAAVVALAVFSRLIPGVGWWPHVWFSTYHMQDSMAGFHPAFSLKVYLTAFGYNLYRSIAENSWLSAYGLLVVISAYFYWAAPLSTLRRRVVLLAMLLAVPAKFVVFPLHDGRIYFSLLLVASLIALAEIVRPGASPSAIERDKAVKTAKP
ncbi:MAG: hypothetical protein VR78_00645 [Hoeflea sp. BRH_c9]|nr:MAG: hypothetical protein VR78_00645 [Hoeflea sp. BRH_c9]